MLQTISTSQLFGQRKWQCPINQQSQHGAIFDFLGLLHNLQLWRWRRWTQMWLPPQSLQNFFSLWCGHRSSSFMWSFFGGISPLTIHGHFLPSLVVQTRWPFLGTTTWSLPVPVWRQNQLLQMTCEHLEHSSSTMSSDSKTIGKSRTFRFGV